MGNDNYHESMEKNRQELSQERMAELTRRARQMPKPKSRGLLLPSLFFIFILIPVTLLIYVAFYYEPDDTLTAKTNENEVSFELNSQPPSDSTVLAAADGQQDDEEDEEEKKSAKAKEAEEQKELKEKAREREEQAAAKAKEKEKEKEKEQAAAEQQAEKKAQETALAEQKAREEAEAKAKAEAEQRAKAEEKEKEQQEEQEEAPTAGGKTVTVQSSETLYRIAVNNYGASGAAAAVEKIKQANGLATNDISPGQTLILP